MQLTSHSQPLLMSRLQNLLERVRVKGKITPGTICSGSTEIPWDNIVLVCMDQKLRDWQIPGPPVYEGEGIFNIAVRLSDDLCDGGCCLLQTLWQIMVTS